MTYSIACKRNTRMNRFTYISDIDKWPDEVVPDVYKKYVGTKWKGGPVPNGRRLQDFEVIGWTNYLCHLCGDYNGFKVRMLSGKDTGKVEYFPHYWITSNCGYEEMKKPWWKWS